METFQNTCKNYKIKQKTLQVFQITTKNDKKTLFLGNSTNRNVLLIKLVTLQNLVHNGRPLSQNL